MVGQIRSASDPLGIVVFLFGGRIENWIRSGEGLKCFWVVVEWMNGGVKLERRDETWMGNAFILYLVSMHASKNFHHPV